MKTSLYITFFTVVSWSLATRSSEAADRLVLVSQRDYYIPQSLVNVPIRAFDQEQFTERAVALKNDGTVLAWRKYGLQNTHPGLTDVIAIASGGRHTVCLKSNGSVTTIGQSEQGQYIPPGAIDGVTAIAAGGYHSVFLKNDGTVAVWEASGHVGEGLEDFLDVNAGSLLVKGQGRVPEGLTGVIAVAAGYFHNLALKGDGTVVAWGYDYQGQCSVPVGLSGVTAIAADGNYSVALKSDGTVVAWGDWLGGHKKLLEEMTEVVSIAAKNGIIHALKADGTRIARGVQDEAHWSGFGWAGIPTVDDFALVENEHLALSAARIRVPSSSAGGIGRSFQVWASGDWSWERSPDSDWLNTSESTSQNGDQNFSFWVNANPSRLPRNAVITLISGGHRVTHTVSQDGKEDNAQLNVTRKVPNAVVSTPDKAGTVSIGVRPAKYAGFRFKDGAKQSIVLNRSLNDYIYIKAASKKGYLFSHWEGLAPRSFSSFRSADWHGEMGRVIGIDGLYFDEDITAVFIANPFLVQNETSLYPRGRPQFEGLLIQEDFYNDESHYNENAGKIFCTLSPANGAISGKVWMDGRRTSFRGELRGDGSVWFKVGKRLALDLPLLDGYEIGKRLRATWSAEGLHVSVDSGAVSSPFKGLAKPRLAVVPTDLLNAAKGRKGYFTLAMPAKSQTWYDITEFPQGTCYASLFLTKHGAVRIVGVLADGTKVTANSSLVSGTECPVFIQLTTPGAKTKNGSFLGNLEFDSSASNSDVRGTIWLWVRPMSESTTAKRELYVDGWELGIKLDPVGSLYDATLPVQNALGIGSIDAANGNAQLEFSQGKLATVVPVTEFNILGNKVEKLNSKDKSFSLAFSAKTGHFRGTFTPNWDHPAQKLPGFQGVLLQKGSHTGGWGSFISNAAGDLAPESGSVSLRAQ